MKARDIMGRRVVAVQQTRVHPGELHAPYVNLDWIEFDNGARLYFYVHEGPDEYGVEGLVQRRGQR